jgi:hypothetical protein
MATSASLLLDDQDICASQSDIVSDLGYRVGVLVMAFAADATVHAVSGAVIRQVLSKPVEFGRLISLIKKVAGTF